MSTKTNKIDAFLKRKKLNCLTTIEYKPNKHFSMRGCDICADGLGNDVYDCNGYSPDDGQVYDGFEVCHECLCIIHNGEER